VVAEDGSLRPGRTFWDEGYYCAESVLLAVAADLGVVSPLVPRIATGFCSGLARTGGTCGAVSGAIMGIGLGTGRDAPSDGLEECYALTTQLLEQFVARFGGTACPELLGCDVRTAEGRRSYQENHLAERCRSLVEEATAMALGLLEGKHRPLWGCGPGAGN
jgi:C_GCAxxG_C_C family probable redox protein